MKAPMQTTNVAMALAMHLAGIRPWRPEHFAMVIYDPKKLEELGCETVRQAVAERKPGNLVCNFDLRDSTQFDHLREIWDDERARIAQNLPSEVEVKPEDVVRIIARALHCRKQLTQDWPDLPIWVKIPKDEGIDVQESESGQTIQHPGFLMVNLRASQETLEHLGLAEPTLAQAEDQEDATEEEED